MERPYRTPRCDIPPDPTRLQSAWLRCDWLRQTGTSDLIHNLLLSVVGENAKRTAGLCAISTFCRTLTPHMDRSEAEEFCSTLSVTMRVTWLQGPVYHSSWFWQGPASHDVTSGGRSPSQPSSGRSVPRSMRHTTDLVLFPLPHSAEHWGNSDTFGWCLHQHTLSSSTTFLPAGSRERWTSFLHRLPYHSFVGSLALGSCCTRALHPQAHDCRHTPPPCCAGPLHMALSTEGQQNSADRDGLFPKFQMLEQKLAII